MYILCLVCFPALIGCVSSRHFQAKIQSENPGDRILAIYSAGEKRDRQSIPLLVDRLEDEDEGVRFFAIHALEKITGQRFGYDYAKPANQRERAVEKWRAYVRNGHHVSTNGNKNENVDTEAVGSATAFNEPIQ